MKCVEIKCGKRDAVEIRDGNGDPLSRLSTLNYLSTIALLFLILNASATTMGRTITM